MTAQQMMQSTQIRRGIVLVVEDELLLRIAALELVEAAGFEAIEASNADEAMRVLEERTDVLIVFTDIDMPGTISGLELASVIRKRWPPIGVIIVSGYVNPSATELASRSLFFPKPYNELEITSALEILAKGD